MRNIRLEIEYNGKDYCGWQKQPRNKSKRPSIQETIERVLRKILQEEIVLTAAGRTDAGVHALAQVANFHTGSEIPLDKLQLALNGNLPETIAIKGISREQRDFHSRYSAKSKVYRYTILNSPSRSALLKGRSHHIHYPLNLALMRAAGRILSGRHDFSAFAASKSAAKDKFRTIKKLRIFKEKELIHIEIEADGFLYNMARNIAGTIVDIGRQKMSKNRLKAVLESKDRRSAGPTLPASGLFLVKVKY